MVSSPLSQSVLVPVDDPAPAEAAAAAAAVAASAAVEPQAVPAGEAVSSVEDASPRVSEDASAVPPETGEGEDGEQATGPRRVWFDSLNDMSLQNIIKHVSKYPRRPDWAGWFVAEDAVMLYTLGGKLSEEAKKMFSHISVWSYFTQNADGENYPYEPEELCLNEQAESSALVARVLLEADHHSSLIALQHLPTAPLASRIWTNLSSRLEPLRALHILGSSNAQLFDSILAAVGPRLTSLGARCDNPAYVNSIAKHCTLLTELTLHERHGNLDAIWTTVGLNLHYLKFDQDIRNVGELQAIKQYCRKIVKLDVYARWEDREINPIVAELYASYGAQLQFANLFTMEPTDYFKVTSSCPNVQCAASFTEFAEEGLLVKEGLEAVGPALSVAVISFGDDTVHMDGMAEAAVSCRNLRELKMNQLGLNAERIICAIFWANKFQLKVLSIGGVKQNSRTCLDVIANNTGALTKFSYTGYMLSMDTQMGMRALVSGNPNLEEVDLTLQGPETAPAKDVYTSTSDEGPSYSRYRRSYTDTYPGIMNPSGSFVDTSPGYSAQDFLHSAQESAGGSESQRPDEEFSWWEQEEREHADGLRRNRARERNSRINDRNQAYAERYGHKFYDGDEGGDYDGRDVPSTFDLADFVSSVKMATSLRRLTIEVPLYLLPDPARPVDVIANACMPFRNRRVHICIGGIYYLE